MLCVFISVNVALRGRGGGRAGGWTLGGEQGLTRGEENGWIREEREAGMKIKERRVVRLITRSSGALAAQGTRVSAGVARASRWTTGAESGVHYIFFRESSASVWPWERFESERSPGKMLGVYVFANRQKQGCVSREIPIVRVTEFALSGEGKNSRRMYDCCCRAVREAEREGCRGGQPLIMKAWQACGGVRSPLP